MRIAVIDDEPANIALLERILDWAEFRHVNSYTDPIQALASIREDPPDLILLDIQMPRLDGFQILRELREERLGEEHIPIVVFTADASPGTRIKALGLGASDFLTKPGEAGEIILRVRNMLEIKHLHRQLRKQNHELERLVEERTSELDLARLNALERLATTGEFRDDDTGEHAKRVGRVAAEIARLLDVPGLDPHLLELAAPLHDIGKVGIPDAILLKPGRLTAEEFDVMKTHTAIGAKILGGSVADVFALAAEIALNHHEKWNGAGYPNCLHGEEIPLSGRIVAVADVFDALIHKRTYKEPWPIDRAVDYICERSGSDFDPAVVEAFTAMLGASALSKAA